MLENLRFVVSLILIFTLSSAISQNVENQTDSERKKIKIGFVKEVDMAPLAIAKELGFFEDEGLDVILESQPNWIRIFNRVVDGELDASVAFTSQVLASRTGFGRQYSMKNICSFGYANQTLTMENPIWNDFFYKKNTKEYITIKGTSLQPALDTFTSHGKMMKFGITFPVSTENYMLRYWLGAGSIHPGFYKYDNYQGTYNAQVQISVAPPPQMPAVLEAGVVNGFMASEPWGTVAYKKEIGVPIIQSDAIFNKVSSKCLMVSEECLKKNEETYVKLVKAIIRAAKCLDDPNNREKTAEILSSQIYVNVNKTYVDASKYEMVGHLTEEYPEGDIMPTSKFYTFYDDNATYPSFSNTVWFLTQMRRWGQIFESQTDEWYKEKANESIVTFIWDQSMLELIEDGKVKIKEYEDALKVKAKYKSIDRVSFDPNKPNDYLKKFKIGLK